MPDTCHSPAAVATAVALANTLRPVRGEDLLETTEQLRAFLDEHEPGAPGDPPTAGDLAEVRALRTTVRDVLERASTDAPAAASLLNEGLRRSGAVPALRHRDGAWWTDVVPDTDRRAARLGASTLAALAQVIATLGPTRLGVCAGPTCRATFVDLSRNGSKQYCTRTCAHRASVAAYRSRQGGG
jgi:predicted RNA-binding Zn ribbon-like protein